MSIEEIVIDLEARREGISRALEALGGLGGHATERPGLPTHPPGRGGWTPEAKARLSEKMKARWVAKQAASAASARKSARVARAGK
jgi:hypothetical protein